MERNGRKERGSEGERKEERQDNTVGKNLEIPLLQVWLDSECQTVSSGF